MANLATIRYGIDLGTTNSALAILEGGDVKIVPNKAQHTTTPSVVYVRGRAGDSLDATVGQDARDALMQYPESVFQEFKKQLGIDPKPVYKPSRAEGIELTAEDLSSLVLREIRNSVRLHGELPPAQAVLVTIPAAFEDPQRDETKAAALKAGFEYVELVPEPEAAALAYGRNSDTNHNPIWLAYDLGGGTFDAALVRGENGMFTIIDHLGDRGIGGSDLDIAIMNELVLPKLDASIRDSIKATAFLWQLKLLIEKVKINLSVQDADTLYFDGFDATLGQIDPVTINRSDVEALQVKIFGPTLDVCLRLLENNNIQADNIEKVILIGGPTQSPFLRTMIEHGAIDPKNQVRYEGLGITTDASVDPMTAVAAGAAIMAAGRRFESKAKESPVNESRISLTVQVPSRSLETDLTVAGTISGAKSYEGWTVRFVREQAGSISRWESEPSAITPAGKFLGSVILDSGLNTFVVTVSDASGDPIVTDYQFEVLQDVGIADRKLPRGLGVADHEGNTLWIFPKGYAIPEGTDTSDVMLELFTTKALKRGASGEALRVPVVSGEHAKAGLNREVAIINITGNDVPTNIPVGSLLRVEASIDTSETYNIEAFLEDFDDLKLTYNKTGGIVATKDDASTHFDDVHSNFELFVLVRDEDEQIDAVVTEIEERKLMELLQEKIDAENWDKAMTDTLALATLLNPLRDLVDALVAWQKHRERCNGNIRKGQNTVDENLGDLSADWLNRWNELLVRYENAKEKRDVVKLEEIAFIDAPALLTEANEDWVRASTESGTESEGTRGFKNEGHVRSGSQS